MNTVDQLNDASVDYSKRSIQKFLFYFMEDTLNRVIDNMNIQQIGEFNPKANWEGVGDLQRSIRATVTKNAGGNEALVRFFYNYYGKFVETATQKGMKYVALPEMESKEAVKRPDGQPRLGKGFLHSQIRRGTKRLLANIAKVYAYEGGAAIWYGVDLPDNKTIHSKNEQTMMAMARDLGLIR